MSDELNNIAILVNNDIIAYEANTLSYADGFGEFSVRNAVVGGGQTEQIFSEDLATKFGMVKFSLPSTNDSAKLVRDWKSNRNNNVVEIMSATGGDFTRIFTQASIQGDPEVNLSTDGNVEIEFKSNPAQ
jgi:hypothetical protein